MIRRQSRRDFLKSVGGGLSLSLLPLPTLFPMSFGMNPPQEEPHFFVQIFLNGGADANSLFDARSLAMTKAGLVTNYLEEEPYEWIGSNGTKTLATSTTKPLLAMKNDFSIINGILVSDTFDGHDQSTNIYFSGNPFGGEQFIPHLNQSKSKPGLLDYLQIRDSFASFTNAQNSLTLNPESAGAMIKELKTIELFDDKDPAIRYLQESLKKNSASDSFFGKGSARLMESMMASPKILAMFKSMDIGFADESDANLKLFRLMSQSFQVGLTRGFFINIQENFDNHDPKSAKELPKLMEKIVSFYSSFIQYLKTTPYDDKRSFYDVTTFVLGSEFTRTMRQTSAKSIQETGTDHNGLCSWALLGGKGIVGGLVLGESDFKSADEKLSPVHLKLDPEKLKTMARPFDFKTNEPKTVLPEKLALTDYIQTGNVINTVHEVFQTPKELQRKPERSKEAPYSVLTKLVRS